MRPLTPFEPHTRALSALARGGLPIKANRVLVAQIEAALDGGVAAWLRDAVPLERRRRIGAFFTPHNLADRLLQGVPIEGTTFFDPSCGAGDLLLAAARRLPLEATPTATVSAWSRVLRGNDMYGTLTEAARWRLVLLAARRHRADAPVMGAEQFTFTAGDALAFDRPYREASCILLNPPYGATRAKMTWGQGRVSKAAIHVAHAVEHVRPGTALLAILPDVLRTGTRYRRWRKWVSTRCEVKRPNILGVFDGWTDVDVFAVRLTRLKGDAEGHDAWTTKASRGPTVKDEYDVRVGAVVPHRDPRNGVWHPYIHARTLEKWTTVREFRENRRFQGRVFAPPFVAIRRTSSPADARRAVATVVAGSKRVAVENHLLVATPHDGTLRSCRELMDQLDDDATDTWLDHRIRCRHLTVSAIEDLPLRGNRA